MTRPITAALCLGALVPLMLGGAVEYVLCVGEDGCVSVEMSSNGSCVPSRNDDREQCPSSQAGLSSEHASHCGSCTDLPLTEGGPAAVAAKAGKDAPGKGQCLASWREMPGKRMDLLRGDRGPGPPLPDLQAALIPLSTVIRI